MLMGAAKPRARRIALSSAALLLALALCACSPAPDLSFADTITVHYTAGGESLSFDITDAQDRQAIVAACTDGARSGEGDCGVDVVTLVFSGGGKETVLLPAGDGCDTMKYGGTAGDRYYALGPGNREKLERVLQKYGASFDYLDFDENP